MIFKFRTLLCIFFCFEFILISEIFIFPHEEFLTPQSIPLWKPPTRKVELFSKGTIEEWTKTLGDRPLFEEGRKPNHMVEATTASAPNVPRLSGIIIGPFGQIAIFSLPDSPKSFTAQEGMSFGVWKLASINQRYVNLVGPDGPHTLYLAFGKQTPSLLPQRPQIMIDSPGKLLQFGGSSTRILLEPPNVGTFKAVLSPISPWWR